MRPGSSDKPVRTILDNTLWYHAANPRSVAKFAVEILSEFHRVAGFLMVGDVEIVDPRASAAPDIARVYAQYPHIGPVLPAMGYSEAQLAALRSTINASEAEIVLAATPIDLARLGGIDKPVVRARYHYADAGTPTPTRR